MDPIDRRYLVTLAAVAAGILVVGGLLRPGPATTDEPRPGPSQAELGRLARLSQRRSIDAMAEYFAAVADDVEVSVVGLPGLGRSGIVWEPDLVVTGRTERRFPDAAILSTPAGDVGVASVTAGPDLPVAALRMSPVEGLSPPRPRAAAGLGRGEWALAVWRRGRQVHFTPAHFLGAAPVRCGGRLVDELLSSVTWTREMAGGGVFDLDGGLMAVVIPCADRFAAVVVDGIAALLRDGQSIAGRLAARYGLRLEPMTEAEQDYFGRRPRLLVREVWTGRPADAAGVAPGDVLLAVNAAPVTDVAQLEPIAGAAANVAFVLTVDRGGDVVNVPMPAASAAADSPASRPAAAGLVWAPPPAGLAVDAVAPGSRAAAAGIRPGDRLLRIDGAEVADADEARGLLSSERAAPAFVELERAGRRLGLLLP